MTKKSLDNKILRLERSIRDFEREISDLEQEPKGNSTLIIALKKKSIRQRKAAIRYLYYLGRNKIRKEMEWKEIQFLFHISIERGSKYERIEGTGTDEENAENKISE